MIDLLQPADVEQAIIDELSPFYSIGTSLPATIPSLFLRVVAVGGFQRDLVSDSFTVVLEAFARKESDARNGLTSAIARVQRSATILGKLGNETCYGVNISGLPANLPLASVTTHKRYTSTLVPDLRRQLITL